MWITEFRSGDEVVFGCAYKDEEIPDTIYDSMKLDWWLRMQTAKTMEKEYGERFKELVRILHISNLKHYKVKEDD